MFEKTNTLKVTANVSITYGYKRAYRKWEFVTPDRTVLIACKGADVAHKVASVLAGAIKRSGKIDNLARNNVDRILAPVVQD